MAPCDLEARGVGGSLDTGGTDQARKGARGIGAAGEADNVDFIAGDVVPDDGLIRVQHDPLQAEPDGSAEQVLQEIRIGADALVVEGHLRGVVSGQGLDQRRNALIFGVKPGYIGVVPSAFLVPGSVNQNDNALHGIPGEKVRTS